MQNTQKVIIGVVVLIIVLLGGYFFFSEEKMGDNTVNNDSMVQADDFGIFSEFVKKDLTDEQKDELKNILTSREQLQEVFSQIISEDSKNGFAQVNQIREDIKTSLLPFISEDMILEFENSYAQLGRDIEEAYVLK